MTGYNAALASGDPVVATTLNPAGDMPGPFAGKSTNCRSCHFVTEFQGGGECGQSDVRGLHDAEPAAGVAERL